jgi:heparosan-N-sulfate-glucuronate 5-epimerase
MSDELTGAPTRGATGGSAGGPPQGPVSTGFFSSASSLSLPAGDRVIAGKVEGYYIDMRAKALEPRWPPPLLARPERRLHVGATQWGLGGYERYLAGEGDAWLHAVCECADELVETQEQEGPSEGGWLHRQPFMHTFPLQPPWLSGMAQGEGASLLVRVFVETGIERYAQAARRALLPLASDVADGGVRALLGGCSFPEEYPTKPPSFVLNGGMFAMWGLYDVGVGLEDPEVLATFHQAIDTLAANLHRWDLGYWSRYDLFAHPVPNVASSFYHDLHVKQLRMTHLLAPRPELAETAERWAGYEASRVNRSRAFAGKSLFRLIVPRSPRLARRLPWSPMRGWA